MADPREPPDRLGFHIFGLQDLPFRFQHSVLDKIDDPSDVARDQVLGNFLGWVVIQDTATALAAAQRANEVPWSEHALVLWTDASRAFPPDGNGHSSSGYAVAVVLDSRWTGRLGHTFETDIIPAELCAISAALDMAVDEIKKLRAQGRLRGPAGPVVKIFSDCMVALRLIEALPSAPECHKKWNVARMRTILTNIGV